MEYFHLNFKLFIIYIYQHLFYIDKCWYHKGIHDITNNIDETVLYFNTIIKAGNYKKVIFMDVSAGGYAAIYLVHYVTI